MSGKPIMLPQRHLINALLAAGLVLLIALFIGTESKAIFWLIILASLVLGGLIIGLIETFWSAYFSIEYKDVAAFSILAIVLIFMPSGILGRPEVEKV